MAGVRKTRFESARKEGGPQHRWFHIPVGPNNNISPPLDVIPHGSEKTNILLRSTSFGSAIGVKVAGDSQDRPQPPRSDVNANRPTGPKGGPNVARRPGLQIGPDKDNDSSSPSPLGALLRRRPEASPSQLLTPTLGFQDGCGAQFMFLSENDIRFSNSQAGLNGSPAASIVRGRSQSWHVLILVYNRLSWLILGEVDRLLLAIGAQQCRVGFTASICTGFRLIST